MGAYQDVLGDLHNLFGEAHEVLVTVDEQGKAHIEDVLPGESCERVLEYMNYDRTEILDSIGKQLRRVAGRAAQEGRDRRRSTGSSRRSSRSTRTWSAERRGSGAQDLRWAAVGLLAAAPARSRRSRPVPAASLARRRLRIAALRRCSDADGQWRGLTIDLWKEIAAETLTYQLPPRRGDARRHPRRHRATAASTRRRPRSPPRSIGSSCSTSATPTPSTGIGIAISRPRDEDRWLGVVEALSTPSALRLYAGIVALVFLAGAALWLCERRRNPQFAGGALAGPRLRDSGGPA